MRYGPGSTREEFGTSRIPPRPFIDGAIEPSESAIRKLAGKALAEAVVGGAVGRAVGGELGELLHLGWEAAKKVGEETRDYIESGSGE